MREPGKYPEHDKLRAIDAGEKRVVTEFLEWVEENGWKIVERHAGCLPAGITGTIESWLAAYFKIDSKKLSREKEALAKQSREFSAAQTFKDKT